MVVETAGFEPATAASQLSPRHAAAALCYVPNGVLRMPRLSQALNRTYSSLSCLRAFSDSVPLTNAGGGLPFSVSVAGFPTQLHTFHLHCLDHMFPYHREFLHASSPA